MTFTISGQPQAAERPRVGKHFHFYSPSSKAQKMVGMMLLEQRVRAGMAILKAPFMLGLVFYHEVHGEGRFDLDNLSKFVMDAGNGVLWEDDSLVRELHARKIATPSNPRTDILMNEWI